MRKKTYGTSVKWRDEYEWFIKAAGGAGGRNLRLTKDVNTLGRPVKNVPKAKNKIDLFIQKYKYNYGEVENKEVVRRHKLTFGFMLTVWVIALSSRLL